MKIKNYLFSIYLLSTSFFAVAQTGITYPASITSGGSARTYTYYVPTVYGVKDTLVPLIINIHGYTGTSAQQETAADFRKIADTANFLILHPQALGLFPSWDVWNTVASGVADRAYIMQCVDSLKAYYKIDTNRIYVTGFSQGGYMSYNLSTNYSERITAMASVAGAMSTDYYNNCYPVHPLPVMEIHGDNDALVPYAGGGNGQPVETTVGHWIQFNNCNTTPASSDFLPDVSSTDKSVVYHYLYTGGCKGVTVEFYRILNGGHQIPSLAPVPTGYGIGTTNQDFTAAVEIWRFFRQYRLDSLYNPGIPETVCVPLSNPAPTPPSIPAPPSLGIEGVTPITYASVYPNPSSNGIFTVESKSQNTSAIISIVNVLGEVVYSAEYIGKTTINLSESSSGIYIYTISDADGAITSGKLIIQ